MGFNEVTAAAQAFAEGSEVFGESFSYQNTALVGVFNQVTLEYGFSPETFRQVAGLVLVTSRPQWATAGLVPVNRGVITYGGVAYQIEKIEGSEVDPAWTLTMIKLT